MTKEILNKKTCDEYRGSYVITEHHSLGRLSDAREKPYEDIELVWEDIGNPRGRFYKGKYRFDPDKPGSKSGNLHTWGNLPFFCPNRHHHHIGTICPCCGQNG